MFCFQRRRRCKGRHEGHALLDIGAASNRVQTGRFNDKRVEYLYSRSRMAESIRTRSDPELANIELPVALSSISGSRPSTATRNEAMLMAAS
jgi:hypothetical protein